MRLARGTASWVLAPALSAAALVVFAFAVALAPLPASASGPLREFVAAVLVAFAGAFFLIPVVARRAKLAPSTLSGSIGAWPFLAALALASSRPSVWLGIAALLVLVALFLLNFFRDPERLLADGLVSPADGRVTEVREERDGGHTIVLFMNVHDVHVNRAPCDARVVRRVHTPGSHLPAWKKDSARNERMTWDLDTPHGPVRVVQIAGLLARRILPYAEEGQDLVRGERLGIIRLGSRVDVTLPAGVAPAVKVGEKVRAGSTTLARASK